MASTYLNKTYSSAGNRNKWTVSVWLKRSKLGAESPIFTCVPNGNFETFCGFGSNDTITFKQKNDGSSTGQYVTNRKFRDTNGFYHLVFVYDKDNSTAGDRGIIYVNGVRETSFSTSSNFSDVSTWNSTNEMWIGRAGSSYFDGVMSHFHFVDGSALAPTVFGSTDSTTGEWKINTSPSYTVGTNGFFILKDGNSVTDSSTNSNAWSVGGGTLTKSEDCASNVFATFNPLADYHANCTFSNGNNKIVSPGDRHDFAVSTLAMNVGSGKYYAEFKLVAAAGSDHCVVGISDHNYMGNNEELSQENYSIAYVNGGALRSSGTNAATGVGTYTAGDIIGVAVDMENLKIYWHKNGTYVNSGVPTSGSTGTGAVSIHNISTSPNSSSRGQGTYFFAAGNWHSGASSTWEANFGNGYFGTTAVSSAGTNASGLGIFEYDVPTGYTALCTKGLNE